MHPPSPTKSLRLRSIVVRVEAAALDYGWIEVSSPSLVQVDSPLVKSKAVVVPLSAAAPLAPDAATRGSAADAAEQPVSQLPQQARITDAQSFDVDEPSTPEALRGETAPETAASPRPPASSAATPAAAAPPPVPDFILHLQRTWANAALEPVNDACGLTATTDGCRRGAPPVRGAAADAQPCITTTIAGHDGEAAGVEGGKGSNAGSERRKLGYWQQKREKQRRRKQLAATTAKPRTPPGKGPALLHAVLKPGGGGARKRRAKRRGKNKTTAVEAASVVQALECNAGALKEKLASIEGRDGAVAPVAGAAPGFDYTSELAACQQQLALLRVCLDGVQRAAAPAIPDAAGWRFLVLDTNVWLGSPAVAAAVWQALQRGGLSAGVRLLVPLEVLRELDSFKCSREAGKQAAARRAISLLLRASSAADVADHAPGVYRGQRAEEVPGGRARRGDGGILDCLMVFRKAGAAAVELCTADRALEVRARTERIPVCRPWQVLARLAELTRGGEAERQQSGLAHAQTPATATAAAAGQTPGQRLTLKGGRQSSMEAAGAALSPCLRRTLEDQLQAEASAPAPPMVKVPKTPASKHQRWRKPRRAGDKENGGAQAPADAHAAAVCRPGGRQLDLRQCSVATPGGVPRSCYR